MEKLVLAGVITLAATLLAQTAARGGLRRRSLTTAGHELEVASKLTDSPLRDALELQARLRIARYLKPPADKTVRRVTRLVVLLVASVTFLGLAALTAPKSPPWLLLIPGVAVGLFLDNIENAVVLRHERRRKNRERPVK